MVLPIQLGLAGTWPGSQRFDGRLVVYGASDGSQAA